MADNENTQPLTPQQIQKHMETSAKAVEAAQTLHAEVKNLIVGQDERIVKALDAAATAMETLQNNNQVAAALQNEVKDMQKIIARGLTGAAGEGEVSKERTGKIVNYMRKGVKIDDSELESICREVATKAVFGNDPTEIERLTKDLSVGSNVDGGFWLMPQRSSKIIKRVFETTPMRMLADIQTTSNDSLEFIVDDDELDGGWVGETQARPDTNTPEIGKLIIPVHEIYAQPKATQKNLDDAGFDVEGWLTNKVSTRFSRIENTSFVNGNSPLQPRGFNTYADAANVDNYEYGKIGTLETSTSNAIVGDDLITLQGHLKEDYQSNAKWLMNRQTFISVATLVDDENRYIFQTYWLEQKLNQMLLGKDIVFGKDMPVGLADGDLAIAYADWSQSYTIVDRYGIRVLRDPYTSKPYVKFYTTKRVGGAVTGFDSIKRLKIKA